MSELVKYVELGDTTNLPRWLNPAHFQKWTLAGPNEAGKLYVVAERANGGGAVFLVPPTVPEQGGFGPWTWFGNLAKPLELKPAP